MSGTVTISIDALETLADAAYEWACELNDHIAPASYDFGDKESGENQELQAVEITLAFDLAYNLIEEATED